MLAESVKRTEQASEQLNDAKVVNQVLHARCEGAELALAKFEKQPAGSKKPPVKKLVVKSLK
jgi:hypothetical protein